MTAKTTKTLLATALLAGCLALPASAADLPPNPTTAEMRLRTWTAGGQTLLLVQVESPQHMYLQGVVALFVDGRFHASYPVSTTSYAYINPSIGGDRIPKSVRAVLYGTIDTEEGGTVSMHETASLLSAVKPRLDIPGPRDGRGGNQNPR